MRVPRPGNPRRLRGSGPSPRESLMAAPAGGKAFEATRKEAGWLQRSAQQASPVALFVRDGWADGDGPTEPPGTRGRATPVSVFTGGHSQCP